MQHNLPKQNELRFSLTSTVGHEVIFSDEDITKLQKACSWNNRELWRKLTPFIEQCRVDYQNKK
jgi:hypothetical protein